MQEHYLDPEVFESCEEAFHGDLATSHVEALESLVEVDLPKTPQRGGGSITMVLESTAARHTLDLLKVDAFCSMRRNEFPITSFTPWTPTYGANSVS